MNTYIATHHHVFGQPAKTHVVLELVTAQDREIARGLLLRAYPNFKPEDWKVQLVETHSAGTYSLATYIKG